MTICLASVKAKKNDNVLIPIVFTVNIKLV